MFALTRSGGKPYERLIYVVRIPILANQFQEAQLLLLHLQFRYRRASLVNSHNTPKARGDGIFTDINGLAVGRFKFEELWATLFIKEKEVQHNAIDHSIPLCSWKGQE